MIKLFQLWTRSSTAKPEMIPTVHVEVEQPDSSLSEYENSEALGKGQRAGRLGRIFRLRSIARLR
jgi:hypothetical protein